MEFQSCLAKQGSIVKLFSDLPTPEEKYEKLIELGRNLPPFPEEDKTEENLVKGCQSKLYLKCTQLNGKLHFQAQSDALISSGIASLLFAVYSDETIETILKCPPDFLHEIGIFSSLSPNRSNGLKSLFLKMQQQSLNFLTKTPGC